MYVNSTSLALIPYTPPKSHMEFIKSEVERELSNGSTSREQLTPRLSIPSLLPDKNLWKGIPANAFGVKVDEPPLPLEIHKILKSHCHFSEKVSSAKKLNGDEIAETLQSEASFTIATDKKPIVATYGCGPCVALGGYEATNKIAFIVHFSHAGEVRKASGLIFYNISKLVKEKIVNPIQLHLRGGVEGQSEATIEAIKIWMIQRKDLPMEIASQEILLSGMGRGKSLSIDSRNGEVAEYDPLANPKSRGMSDLDAMSAMMSAFEPNIKLAYSPK